MATVKEALANAASMTVTALNSLASSATAGWQSAVVDNSSDLAEDALVQVVLDFANTAPANDKAVYVYAYTGIGTNYTEPCTGSEGTVTITNPNNLRLIGVLTYQTADMVIKSGVMSVATAFGGVLPAKWGLVIINYTGAAIAATGNSVTYQLLTHTVA
jgi:hypothetical protein